MSITKQFINAHFTKHPTSYLLAIYLQIQTHPKRQSLHNLLMHILQNQEKKIK